MSKHNFLTGFKVRRTLINSSSKNLNSSPECKRRVVVTGIGIVSPLGVGTLNTWQALLDCKCGVVKLDSPEYDKLPCKIG
jgi:3-oxoacyl-[acyl-carrier-protein] synthase II